MQEFNWIKQYFAPLSRGEAGGLGLTDDVALITPPAGQQLVITTDTLHEGVHFLANTDPAMIARKALRVNLSDLAAKGVAPHAYLLALSLGAACDEHWIRQFTTGLAEDQALFGCHLIGGDTTRSLGPLSITITMMGFSPPNQLLLRSGATAGDVIYVSGTIGDAAIGLHQLQHTPLPTSLDRIGLEYAISRYHLPQPRVALGQALVGIATASMDVSDGLIQDLEHVCTYSGVGAEVHLSRILTLCTSPTDALRTTLVTAGDDYELLFTAPPAQASALASLSLHTGVAITPIGTITATAGVNLYDSNGDKLLLEKKGYQHV